MATPHPPTGDPRELNGSREPDSRRAAVSRGQGAQSQALPNAAQVVRRTIAPTASTTAGAAQPRQIPAEPPQIPAQPRQIPAQPPRTPAPPRQTLATQRPRSSDPGQTTGSAPASSAPLSAASSSSLGADTAVEMHVPAAPSWLGKRVGRFRLVSLLGQGAMGRVFRVEDTLLQRHVALKVLPRKLKRGDKMLAVERLIKEAQAASTLDHPNVVNVFEVNEASGVYYIAMELVEGGSLRDLVKAAGPLDYARACLLCADAADALAQAHSLGIIHRDIKPANLMLTRAGRCKVADFGLARIEETGDLSRTLPESVGTPQFVAPEILRGTPASARSDIYSLGATLWYLLTGKPPFTASTAAELLAKHLEAPLPDLAALRPDLPESLVRAIRMALAKQPGERFESAAQFARILRVYTIPVDVGSSSGLRALVGPAAEVAPADATRLTVAPPPAAASVNSAALLAPSRPAVVTMVNSSQPALADMDAAGVQAAPALLLPPPAPSGFRRHGMLIGAIAAVVIVGVVSVPILKRWISPPARASQPPLSLASGPAVRATVPPIDPVARPALPRIIDLMPMVDLEKGVVSGTWKFENGDLVGGDDRAAKLELPYHPPAEYDFTVEFTSGVIVEQHLFKKPGEFNWCILPNDNYCAFECVQGKKANENRTRVNLQIDKRVRHISCVQVRNDRVRALLDGQLVREWRTDYHDLTMFKDWVQRDNSVLGLGVWGKSARFHKITVTELPESRPETVNAE